MEIVLSAYRVAHANLGTDNSCTALNNSHCYLTNRTGVETILLPNWLHKMCDTRTISWPGDELNYFSISTWH